MNAVQAYVSWPGSHLKEIAGAVAIGALMVITNFFWKPSVDPRMPAELAVASPEHGLSTGMIEEESLDFIFRPLLLPSRRPLERSVEAEEPSVTISSSEALSPTLLEGYQLMGVFASGGTGGAILLDESKEQLRLRIGESLQGWRLERTDLRSAHFIDSAGATAFLELAMASTLPAPEVYTPTVETESTTDSASMSNAGGKPQTASEYDGPVTFESIAARQKREMEIKGKSGNP